MSVDAKINEAAAVLLGAIEIDHAITAREAERYEDLIRKALRAAYDLGKRHGIEVTR